jgi:hypothetical protein
VLSESNSALIDKEVKRIMRIALKCVAEGHRDTLRAETFERYARNQLNLAQLNRAMQIEDTAKGQIQVAIRVARLGLTLMQKGYDNDKREATREDAPFATRISATTEAELYELLLGVVKSGEAMLR